MTTSKTILQRSRRISIRLRSAEQSQPAFTQGFFLFWEMCQHSTECSMEASARNPAADGLMFSILADQGGPDIRIMHRQSAEAGRVDATALDCAHRTKVVSWPVRSFNSCMLRDEWLMLAVSVSDTKQHGRRQASNHGQNGWRQASKHGAKSSGKSTCNPPRDKTPARTSATATNRSRSSKPLVEEPWSRCAGLIA